MSELASGVSCKYCGECGMPTEQCIYGGKYDKCLQWLRENDQEEYKKLLKKVLEEMPKRCKSSIRSKADKRAATCVGVKRIICAADKYLTVVTGLDKYLTKGQLIIDDISAEMNCRAILTEKNAIVLYGDYKETIKRYISEKFHIDPLDIIDKGDLVRTEYKPKQ